MISEKKDEYAKVIKQINKKLKRKGLKKRRFERKINLKMRGRKKHDKELVAYYQQKKSFNPQDVFGLIIIAIGFCFFINSIFLEITGFGLIFGSVLLNVKIGIMFTLVGFFFIYIYYVTETEVKKETILDARKLAFAIIIWVIAIFFITLGVNLDIYLILIFIGILTIKELAEEFIDYQLKIKMKYLSYITLIIFFVVLVLSMANILGE